MYGLEIRTKNTDEFLREFQSRSHGPCNVIEATPNQTYSTPKSRLAGTTYTFPPKPRQFELPVRSGVRDNVAIVVAKASQSVLVARKSR